MSGYDKIEELNELLRSLRNMRQSGGDEHVRTPPLNYERRPIPMYYGKRKDLSAFLSLFLNWVISQGVDAALTNDVSVVMTTQTSWDEMC